MYRWFDKILTGVRYYASGRLSIKKFIPGIAWFFILLFLLLLPGQSIPESTDWMDYIFIDKWIHLGFFTVLGILFFVPVLIANISERRKRMLTKSILIGLLIWGVCSEFVQQEFAEGRFFDIADVVADSLGSILSVFISKRLFLPKQR